MVQVLDAPPPKRPSFLQSLMGGVAEGVGPALEKYESLQRGNREKEAIRKKFGDEIANLPPELQKLFAQEQFKSQFAPQGQKPLTELQQSQKALADERLKALQGQQDLFSKLRGDKDQTNVTQESKGQSQGNKNPLSQAPDDILNQTAAFAGQPGEAGVIGNMAKAEVQRRKEEGKIDYQSFKDNKDYTEKLLTGYEGYKRDQMVLDQMEKISNKGNLPKPLAVKALEKLGIPLGILENPDAEQFEKLSTELLKNIQGTFGSRILQSEVNLFMRSIPTLLNSPEGQKKLIDQWKILNEGKKIYFDAYKQIKKENPKRLPPDLHEQVIERAEPMLDNLADQFRSMNEPNTTRIRSPDGKIRQIPKEMLESALQAGGEMIE